MKNQTRIDNLSMDLQLFAGLDDEAMQASLMEMFNAPGEADPNTAIPTESTVEVPEGAMPPQGTETPTETPTETTVPEQSTEAPIEDGQSANPDPQAQQMIGGKFKSVDELLNAYTNLESMTTKKAQEAAQYKAMAEKLQLQNSQQVDPAQQTSQGAETPEEVDPLSDNESLSELMYSDPARLMQMILDRARTETQSTLAPITQERDAQAKSNAWRERVDAFSSEHEDVNEWTEPMARVLMQNPELKEQENGLQIAYEAAKGQKYAPQQAVDPKSYLQDPNFVNENVIGNEEIEKQIIQKYLAKLQNGGTPMTIGQSPVGGSTTLTPRKEAKTMEEAEEQAMSLFTK